MQDTADQTEQTDHYCINDYCQEEISPQRFDLGYRVCLACGDRQAVQARKLWTVVPMLKSNYVLVTDLDLLKGLNKYANS
jgi:hypothetical protein